MQVIYGIRPKTSALNNPILTIENNAIMPQVKSFCYLGVTLHENMTIKTHMSGTKTNAMRYACIHEDISFYMFFYE